MSNLVEFLWSQKYRPHKISDTILPKNIKDTFQEFVNKRVVPNLLLSGESGVGKTTVARALLEEIQCDYIIINGSLNGNIDTLRNEIMQFASTRSLSGGRKYVILDEADYLNPQSTQPALRNFMEEFSKNCGFILTCNFKNKIIEPLHSRCSVIDFIIPKDQKQQLAVEFFKRIKHILNTEDVKYDQKVIAALIESYFPDWRRIINEIQRSAATGTVDSGALISHDYNNIRQLITHIKNKDFSNVRKWVAENDPDSATFFRKFYDACGELLAAKDLASLIIILAKYQYQAAFVADSQINISAFCVECMIDLEFKND